MTEVCKFFGETKLVEIFLTGLVALLGAFIGARYERTTQHRSWLLERRAEIFTEFLRVLAKCVDEASILLQKTSAPSFPSEQKSLEIQQKFLEIYQPAYDSARIVRLFLQEESRGTFEELVSEIYSLHTTKSLGDARIKTFVKKREALQKLFEQNFKNPKW